MEQQSSSMTESRKRKRRKTETSNSTAENSSSSSSSGNEKKKLTQWRNASEQKIYSTKLLEAVRQVRLRTNPSSPHNIREAADRLLAVRAKGRTSWSRAILLNRHKQRKSRVLKKVSVNKRIAGACARSSSTTTGKGRVTVGDRKLLPDVDKKFRTLGKLVPGCKKMSFPSILEEASDYIAALEMQVKAMAVLANLLAGTSPSSDDRLTSPR